MNLKNDITHIRKNKIQKTSKANFNGLSAQVLKNSLERLSAKKKIVNIALSGGSTPLPILDQLRKIKLDWRKFNFFLVDERVVDINSTESNYNNIYEVFYQYLPSQSFPILLESNTLEEMILVYKEKIEKNVTFNESGVPNFDLVILGMGTDGHTASLFPETQALHENKDFVVKNYVPKLKSYRVSLTFPTLLNSDEIIVLIKGAEKIKIFEEIMTGEGKNYPISRLTNTNLNWVIGY